MKTFTEWVTIVGYVFSAFVVAVHLLSLIWEYLPRHWRLAALIWVREYLSAALMEVNASVYEIDPRCSCGAALAVPEEVDSAICNACAADQADDQRVEDFGGAK